MWVIIAVCTTVRVLVVLYGTDWNPRWKQPDFFFCLWLLRRTTTTHRAHIDREYLEYSRLVLVLYLRPFLRFVRRMHNTAIRLYLNAASSWMVGHLHPGAFATLLLRAPYRLHDANPSFNN